MKFVKNNSGAVDTWVGKQLAIDEVWEIPLSGHERWQKAAHESGSKVETDVLSGDLQVSKDGVTFMSMADGLGWLKAGDAEIVKSAMVMSMPADGQILRYNATNEKWECKGLGALEGGMSKIDFHFSGSGGGKWLFAPYGGYLGQASDVVPFVCPFDFQVTSLIFTNKKSDADAVLKIHKNMDLVTPAFTWTLPINSIWAVKNSGLSTWTFNQFDKISVWIEGAGNNPDDIYFELNGYYFNKNETDGSGGSF